MFLCGRATIILNVVPSAGQNVFLFYTSKHEQITIVSMFFMPVLAVDQSTAVPIFKKIYQFEIKLLYLFSSCMIFHNPQIIGALD